jgi:hypothetical protein
MTTLSATVAMRDRWGSLGLVKRTQAVKRSARPAPVKPARPAKRRGPALTIAAGVTDLLPGLIGLPELHIGLTAEAVAAIHQQETDIIIAELRARFPLAFTNPAVPFALGFRRRIRRATKASIPASKLCRAVRWWIAKPAYQAALAAGQQRRRLDGRPAQFPTVEQIALARERLGLMPRPILLSREARAHLRAVGAGCADCVGTKPSRSRQSAAVVEQRQGDRR